MDRVEKAISEWEPRWEQMAADLVRTGLWLPIEVHDGLQPVAKIDDDAFISGSFMNLDGKVFTCAHSRKASAHSSAMHSNKTGTSGLQCLGWSAPCGIPLIVRVAVIVLPVSASLHSLQHVLEDVHISTYAFWILTHSYRCRRPPARSHACRDVTVHQFIWSAALRENGSGPPQPVAEAAKDVVHLG